MIEQLLMRIEELSKRVAALEAKELRFSVVAMTDGVTAPTTATGKAFIYIDTTDGDLKIKFGDGVTKTIVADT